MAPSSDALSPDAKRRHLVKHLGPEAVILSGDAMAPYLAEWRGRFPGRALAVLCPADTRAVSRAVACCADLGLAIVPQSGNTGLVGGGSPQDDADQVVLSLERMDRVRAIDPENNTLTVEAGCRLVDVQRAARDADRLFPLSLPSEAQCRIGGNLGSNAGGTNVLRYGNTRELALGLEVVLADGQVWSGLTGLRKDNSGLDLRDLFIGSEGTLGIITAAVFRLYPLPRDVQTALVAVPDPARAIALLRRLQADSGDTVTACELMNTLALELGRQQAGAAAGGIPDTAPWYLLVELASPNPHAGLREVLAHSLAEAQAAGEVNKSVVAVDPDQRQQLWSIREGIPGGQSQAGASIKHDISLPISRLPDFLAQAAERVRAEDPRVRLCTFGHVGDGNLHFNLSQPEGMARDAFLAQWTRYNDLIHDLVTGMGGSIAAEHGVGLLKAEALRRHKDPVELDLMRRIKQALDPENRLNPGKLIPGDEL
ncbi:FAD/FMN-containing dehydrogenase [Alkalispirillum mobile]|uniref:FAD/FMN-containing dehydrogenase n=1 Tax=Alkalispirillum mobile TaxID=85925 RepID=A0A498CDR4_9GAMM|nr:FAD-binding oxidoreductase [Alkalispirillum mobile]RLK51450.1 FAD/FMN-containing dehydrogenase [Alkalispirillum mobile]